MQPSRRPCIYAWLYASLAMLMCLPFASRTHADTLTITSDPAGAAVEIDSMPAGTTPYEVNFPGGYFHKTHTAFGARLEHAMQVRVSKAGYVGQQITLTSGPYDWVSVNGRRRGNYFLLKSDSFHIILQAASHIGTAALLTGAAEGPLPPANVASGADAKSGNSRGVVSISSEPIGLDISVDGKFVGQTPSTIPLDAGLHRVEVKTEAGKVWERDVEVIKDSQVTLRATFPEHVE
jgi:hypothetical protein